MADFTLEQQSPRLWVITSEGKRYYHKSAQPMHIPRTDDAKFYDPNLQYTHRIQSAHGEIVTTSEIRFERYYEGTEDYDLVYLDNRWTLQYKGRAYTARYTRVHDEEMEYELRAKLNQEMKFGGVFVDYGSLYLYKTHILSTDQGEWPIEMSLSLKEVGS